MSLNGSATELVYESGKGWHGRSEDGSRIEKLSGAGNGDGGENVAGDGIGEYWKVTGADGTQYFFGRHSLPGYSAATDSTNTVRVYGNHPGEPCNASSFASSSCNQAWRWNLDYVVDTRGNTVTYWYDKETNQYAANATGSSAVSYVRASTLARIDYGTWDRGSTDRSATPVARVVFTTADRCLSSCATHDAEHWPDVPWDQECKADATSCGTKHSPTFWTTRRLAKVTTRVWDTTKATPAWQDVESWTLSHTFPPPGDGSDHAGLWLDKIVHAGHVGGTVTMPPVTFDPVSLPNRVLTDHNTTNNWHRIGNVITEAGAKIQVTYSLPECASGNLPASAHTNTKLCYPVIGPDPNATDGSDHTEWWHKYVVRQISESDVQLAGGHQAPTKNTYYTYAGSPAWHYADDDGLTKPKYKTWNQFRGYATVRTRVGDTVGGQTLTVTSYLRGMHGDRLAPSGGARSVTVLASVGGETVYDHDQFAGIVREQVVYNGTETTPISKTVNVPWMSSPTASRTINGDTVTARFVNTATTYNATALGVDGVRGWRTTRVDSTYHDTYGTVGQTYDRGDTGKPGDERCINYSYNRNVDKNILGTAKRITTTALPCGTAPTGGDHIISDLRNVYDGASSPDTAPVYGDVTKTEQLKDWTAGGGTVWQTTTTLELDAFGRETSATDIRGNTTTTAYTPTSGGPVTSVKTTSPAPYSWVTTVDKAPYWGHTTRTVDANARGTDIEYDPLGRVAKLWKIGWAKADHPATPSEEYSYSYSGSRSEYPYVEARTLNAAGTYTPSYQILDGFLRVRQVQTAGANGNRVVSDTIYDELGRETTAYGKHAEPGTPSGTLWWEPEWSLRSLSKKVYDNASRPVAKITMAGDGRVNLVEKWRTTTEYQGDLTKVTPPPGGTPTTTVIDAHGRTVQLREHTSTAGVDGPYDTTSYEYNGKGQLVRVIDPAGNEWTSTYDLKGRQTRADDPDKGETRFEFNEVNELIRATDARDRVLRYEYDQLGRKTAIYEEADSAATKRVEWKYDRLYTGVTARGQLTETIRYEGGQAYKRQVVNLNARYQATGVNYVIPYAETGLGGTYTFSYGFSPYDGSSASVAYPAAGGLGGELVTTTYGDSHGLPVELKSNAINVGGYVVGQDYTEYGEPTVTTRKVAGGVYVQDAIEYDPATRRVTRTTMRPETAPGRVWDRRYDYDAAGNVLSIADAPEIGAGETQCFRYDSLRRLTTAWTPKAGITCGSTPTVADIGGAAPYWTDWTFDNTGNRLTETSHTAGGETVRSFAVPAGGAGVVRPHAVTGVTTQAPGQPATAAAYAYDATGNTVARPAPAGTQALTWDAEGRLETASDAAGTTTHVYDGDGNRLIRRDPAGTTLFLPGMEIRRATGTSSNVAVRYYQFAGRTIASRTAAGGLQWLYADLQGTQQAAVNADTQAVTVRRQTPYGGQRGEQPTWPNGKGFVGGDIDRSGLVHVGAREYDSALGRFVSVDPIVDFDRPQQMHGYAYALNAPTTFSDPTGLRPPEMSGAEWSDHVHQKAQESQNTVKTPPPVSNPRLQNILKNDIYARPSARNLLKDGKVATAVSNEFETGQKTGPNGGKWHYEKAARAFASLSDLLEDDRVARSKGTPGLLTSHDRAVAKLEAMELWQALNSEDTAGKWTEESSSSAAGRASRRDAKNAIEKAANRPATADITGAKYEQGVHEGKPVGRPVQKVSPRIRGAAGALGVMGNVAAVGSGLQQAYGECGWDCSAPEVSNHLMCAMIPGCQDPQSYTDKALGIENPGYA